MLNEQTLHLYLNKYLFVNAFLIATAIGKIRYSNSIAFKNP